MHWRLIDKIERLKPWAAAAGAKAISFEEYCLYEPFGRQGVLPPSLAVESCVQLLRWLVARSSGFESTCTLAEIETFSFLQEARIGEVLAVSAQVVRMGEERLAAECLVSSARGTIARGTVTVGLLPLAEGFDPETTRGAWRELYGST